MEERPAYEPRPEESSEEEVGKGKLGADPQPRDLVESSGEWAEVNRASPEESTEESTGESEVNSAGYETPELEDIEEDETEGS